MFETIKRGWFLQKLWVQRTHLEAFGTLMESQLSSINFHISFEKNRNSSLYCNMFLFEGSQCFGRDLSSMPWCLKFRPINLQVKARLGSDILCAPNQGGCVSVKVLVSDLRWRGPGTGAVQQIGLGGCWLVGCYLVINTSTTVHTRCLVTTSQFVTNSVPNLCYLFLRQNIVVTLVSWTNRSFEPVLRK